MEQDYRRVTQSIEKIMLLRRMELQPVLSKLGLYKGQLPVLRYIFENGGCTQSEMAEHLGVSAASVAQSAKRMERAGLLERKPDAQDLRANRLYITDAGLRAMNRAGQAFDLLDRRMYANIPPQDLQTSIDTFERIIQNLTGQDSDQIELHALMDRFMKLQNRHKHKENEHV